MTTKKSLPFLCLPLWPSLPTFFSFNTGVKHFMVSFNYIPCFIAGAFLGPVEGFIVGFMGDLLGGLIRPLGTYIPLIGIASGAARALFRGWCSNTLSSTITLS